MKVAIIRLSALGDVVVSAVFLPFLKQRYKGVKIHWFVDENFAPILKDAPHIDVLHALPYKRTLRTKNPLKIWRFYSHLRSLGVFDLIIDMQGLLKSALIGLFLAKKKPKHFVGFDRHSIREKLASLFYTHKVSIPYGAHILERNACVLKGGFDLLLKIKEWENPLQERNLAFFCPNSPKLEPILNTPTPKVLFVLETSRAYKTYPLEGFKQVGLALKDCGLEILILSHAHLEQAQELYACLSPQVKAVLLPLLTLEEVKTLVAGVSVVVGGDTGVVHLAWALKTPSVTLYGNTPKARFELKGKHHIALAGNLQADFAKNGFSINDIPPLAIKEAVLEVLKGAQTLD
ncbi:lipopolysaccharide heptosyltransferase I [Helicobacter ailurogastricus]|uniref:lipopolysaccharide heptosyltransferase I n=1 Tax=Helicobacter ailurogastricus TaxID=1578720 RepID=UPI000CF05BEF|nr:lipopolysaccharide heptosyltransferase I [Helicobacter ailurogastricus]GLH58097.1 Lipopolysaccharide heptosyltransferase RfaC [Helicobacter ailurogastricus]GLH58922.1 Lipopolysaccharide heptosyltransferase RfaC [Helicobacter ailurogastricus]GMB89474.1 Lipopolysaccharide heptosyltransferase RfaC [Helicobacter ailurogastricus]